MIELITLSSLVPSTSLKLIQDAQVLMLGMVIREAARFPGRVNLVEKYGRGLPPELARKMCAGAGFTRAEIEHPINVFDEVRP